MSGVWCYVEREAGGAAIARLRLVDAAQVRVWTPQSLAARSGESPGGDGQASAPGAPAGVERVRQDITRAAIWLRDQLGHDGPDGELVLCLDAAGARCQWISAPSASPSVVSAVALQLATGGTEDGATTTGTAGVWSPAAGQVGVDLSLQPLSPGSPRLPPNGSTLGLLDRFRGRDIVGSDAANPAGVSAAGASGAAPKLGKGARTGGDKPSEPRAGGTGGGGAPQRLAVLAVPDLAVRLLLDELDRLSVRVGEVTSVWHASARAWDPSNAAALSPGRLGDDHGDDRLVASSDPVTAVVVIEPTGRLHWSWAQSGGLLAAGTMRVARVEATMPDAEPAGDADALPRPDVPISVIEIHRADVGRVVAEWLSWAAELGLSPSRVVCIGPGNVVCGGLEGDLPVVTGVGAVGAALAKGWQGAAATAAVIDDPVSTALQRLAAAAGRGNVQPPAGSVGSTPGRARGGAATVRSDDDGRRTLAVTASRPGRAVRTLYAWRGAVLVALAGLLGAGGYVLNRSAADASPLIEAQAAQRETELKRLGGPRSGDLAPDSPTVLVLPALQAAEQKLRDDAGKMPPERPVLSVLSAVLSALDEAGTLVLDENAGQSVRVDSLGVSVALVAQTAAAARDLEQALQKRQVVGGRVQWSTTATVRGDRREVKLTGVYADSVPIRPRSTTPGTAGGKPPPPAGPNAAPTSPAATAPATPAPAPTPAPNPAPTPAATPAPAPAPSETPMATPVPPAPTPKPVQQEPKR